jgi:hypothetical protein
LRCTPTCRHASLLLAPAAISAAQAARFSACGAGPGDRFSRDIATPKPWWRCDDHSNPPVYPGATASGDTHVEPVGTYRTRINLSGHRKVEVQLWNDTTNRELAASESSLLGRGQVTLSGKMTRHDPQLSAKADRGFALFQINPVPAFPGNVLETRIYAESAGTIQVRSVSLRSAAS